MTNPTDTAGARIDDEEFGPRIDAAREGHPVQRTKRNYMPCPRQCGVDVRDHHSSDLVNGRCDTGLMPLDDMIEWLEARGVGQPGYFTVAEAISELYGKTEDELEAIYAKMHGSMA